MSFCFYLLAETFAGDFSAFVSAFAVFDHKRRDCARCVLGSVSS
ncbi:hypothetical protein HMPREF1584_00256 [Gardnerella vaginalis JCP8481A]|nr:hypothetical protein HMPREF1584_00256 [Gardnerella vaginalis JCP8481A]